MSRRYLAFGSNMSWHRLHLRLGADLLHAEHDQPEVVILPEWTLAFCKMAGDGSGYASLLPRSTGDEQLPAEAVLWQVTETGLLVLDSYEGVPDHYRRETWRVTTATGHRRAAEVYLHQPSHEDLSRHPRWDYLHYLLVGARQHLTSAYSAWLADMACHCPKVADGPAAVFVYGTLQRDQSNSGVWPVQPLSVSPVTAPGRLFDLGPYPALRPGSGRVCGELWRFQQHQMVAVLEELDLLEGYRGSDGDMYTRCVSQVTVDGRSVAAWLYVFATPLPEAKRIFGEPARWPPRAKHGHHRARECRP